MKITKFGHCCLLLEVGGKRVLTDPGRFSDGQNALLNIDVILITHEHADHFHTSSIQAILDNNPQAEVITNSSVGKLLTDLEVTFTTLEGREDKNCNGLQIKAYDGEHVEIFEKFGLVQNTGYAVNGGEFFFPGDSYVIPEEKVRVLAAPVAGPWCKVAESIRYILEVAPEVVVPVHDATLSEVGKSVTYPHFTREIEKQGGKFVLLENEVEIEL
jgi:L-ascorbate metabolism protein UlaG (beta-lactamase superfamily)